jgi:hypothetical protein
MINITSPNPGTIQDGGSANIFNKTAYVNFNYDPSDAIISDEVHDNASDGTHDTFLDGIVQYGLVYQNGLGDETFSFVIPQSFFLGHTDPLHGHNFEIDYTLTLYEYVNDGSGFLTQVGMAEYLLAVKLTVNSDPIQIASLQNDFLGITRTSLSLADATTEANAINAGTTTETAYVNSLLTQVADTTIPVVAVEGSMYGAVGSSVVITNLVTNFLPGQIAYATQVGLDPVVFACLETSLVFAFANESGNTSFANNYGPSNAAMPATAAGDSAFAAAATNAIFGSAQTANTPNAILGYVHFLEGFFTANGIVGVQNPTPDQIVIAARAGAWGEGIAIALENNLGSLPGQATNFLEDAAQGTAIYSASLASQPTAGLFQGGASAAASHVQVTGVAAPIDHVLM